MILVLYFLIRFCDDSKKVPFDVFDHSIIRLNNLTDSIVTLFHNSSILVFYYSIIPLSFFPIFQFFPYTFTNRSPYFVNTTIFVL